MNSIQKAKSLKADDYLRKNLVVLKKYHPDAWNKIKGFNGPLPGEITGSGSGLPNLRLVRPDREEVFLHDPEDPMVDARRNLAFVSADSRGNAVFLGMGLGYAPLSFATERPKLSSIIIFEPSIEISFAALKCNDLTRLFTDRRTIIHIGEINDLGKIIAPATSFLQLEDIHFLKHRGSFRWMPELYEQYSNKVYSYLNHLNIDGGTRLKKGKKILDNKLESLSMLPGHLLLEDLRDLFQGRPAFLVAGGPSLDKNIEDLKPAMGRGVIIAADSVLPALLAHDILPDFITSIDYQDLVYEKIADCAQKAADRISLICLSGLTNLVPRIFPFRQVFWAFSCSDVDRWINHSLGGSLVLPGAGSMAHLSLQSAIVMGCDPILFVGQDLAYTGSNTHASHTVYSSSVSRAEQIFHKKGEKMEWVRGNNQDKVPTCRAFLNHKRFFEEIIATNPKTYINSTEGGAYIKGTQILPLREGIRQYCPKALFSSEKDLSFDRNQALNRTEGILNSIEETTSGIDRLSEKLRATEDLASDVLHHIRKYMARGSIPEKFTDLPAKVIKKLRAIDQRSRELDQEPLIWPLVQDYTLRGLKECNRLQHDIDIISGIQGKYIEFLKLNLKKLRLANKTREKALIRLKRHLLRAEKILSERKTLYVARRENNKPDWLTAMGMNHYQGKELAGARSYLEKARARGNLPAEALAALGEIYALYGNFSRSRTLFKEARSLNPEICSTIHKRMTRHGKRYLELARRIPLRKGRFLSKAVQLCPDSPEIRSEMENMLLEDLDLIAHPPGDTGESDTDIETGIQGWLMFFGNSPEAKKVINSGLIIKMYRHGCNFLLNQGHTDKAIEHLQQAVSWMPENSELTSMLAIALINKGDFDQGFAHLEKAVELDRTCASCWEELGDVLLAAGQPEDAVIAYEKCFKALPERNELIKKIGDCYRESGKMEAALEAYKIYKNRITQR